MKKKTEYRLVWFDNKGDSHEDTTRYPSIAAAEEDAGRRINRRSAWGTQKYEVVPITK